MCIRDRLNLSKLQLEPTEDDRPWFRNKAEPMTGRPFGEDLQASCTFLTLDRVNARRSMKITEALTARCRDQQDELDAQAEEHQLVTDRIEESVARHEEHLHRIQMQKAFLEQQVQAISPRKEFKSSREQPLLETVGGRVIPEHDKTAWTLAVERGPEMSAREETVKRLVQEAFEQTKKKIDGQIKTARTSLSASQEQRPERATWTPTLYHRRRMLKQPAAPNARENTIIDRNPKSSDHQVGDGNAFGREHNRQRVDFERRHKDTASGRGARGADVFRVYRKPAACGSDEEAPVSGRAQPVLSSPRTPVQGLGVIALPNSPRFVQKVQ
eukprot:TRINITY_DN6724_c0_g1_i1.p1 TRINITY_DN6724_c0_g1~~TRINITY_DN6724_c0_g1_i1.p1  ORF type:complete len:328 (+),score=73.14 TRINITY_DN6724_c0_g1_i1:197-1180(+)